MRGAHAVGRSLRSAFAGVAAPPSLRRPNGRFRLAAPAIARHLGVAVLHSLQDSTHGVAIRSVARVTDAGPGRALFSQGYIPAPTEEQARAAGSGTRIHTP
ncbi:hypothetical protein GA0115254_11913 [Streptomyces sp. Ncost-T10-10d]|nr:hypothetical protein GA0115254_11913 [Streptomyces sp. Ncost-T10-10d]